jgi:taurine-pyruvate aminotransferase
MAQGVIIGASNRSMPGLNNTLLFAPALIATKGDLDEVVAGVDAALTRVVG